MFDSSNKANSKSSVKAGHDSIYANGEKDSEASIPSPFYANRLQQTIGNKAVGQLLQRAIKKPGKKSETYAPGKRIAEHIITANITGSISQVVMEEIQRIHLEEEDMTFKAAHKLAIKNVKSSNKRVTGRGGTRITDSNDLINQLTGMGVNMTKADPYITKHSALFDTSLTEMEILLTDLPVTTAQSADQVKTAVTDTFMEMPSQLIRTVSSFNSFADAEVAAEKSVSSAWKGNQFEQWVDVNLFPAYKQRQSFAQQGTMKKSRDCDGFDSSTDEMWDYKHVSGLVDVDQVDDYEYILKNKVKSTTGVVPTAVNYLFQDLVTAQLNAGLKTRKNFRVWYVQSGLPPQPVQI
ncbi:hypothetical protein [Paenibacillus hexagrammi]|uniref:Uncharacterized protein n=1 Tax=Paenibacillus hexagrammi TaxID=2908839 RepID=A0ABY3SLT6_9BACL|nr:hypothetical protein [Paenibacillus sp. YPD9-1]UJF34505.1 hypothetical protein L0M14_04800 [Paenibacillus sp. YPD9-1]